MFLGLLVKKIANNENKISMKIFIVIFKFFLYYLQI